jgi:hypothetical protein
MNRIAVVVMEYARRDKVERRSAFDSHSFTFRFGQTL